MDNGHKRANARAFDINSVSVYTHRSVSYTHLDVYKRQYIYCKVTGLKVIALAEINFDWVNYYIY